MSADPAGSGRARRAAWWIAQWQQPGPAQAVLLPLSWLFAGLSAARRQLYRWGVLRSHAVPRPVIVVGNLIAGGAGKTPVVIALVQLLRQMGHVPGVISRGHGGRHTDGARLVTHSSDPAEVGDEPLLIHLRTGAPVAVARQRVLAAQALCQAHPAVTVLVADDGLQHLALARDLDVLVFDDRGIGNGRLLPAGPLRQHLPAALPPRTLVIYGAGQPSTPLPGFIGWRRLGTIFTLQDWWVTDAVTSRVVRLRDRPLLAAAGLARPEAFFTMLEAQGLKITRLPLPDHFDYATLPWPPDTPDVIVTEKDAVKLRPDRVGRTQVWVATLDFALPADFQAALQRLLPPAAPTR
ncbi:tetraacyldisaccharide 4'-kinase [Aquabacterium sp.]|uniref:tetraacyldisaccharide 4'-kinase n=1 Tax=Aquabacterium sp. TaxID=1872578 RepID=UPI002B5E0163|nr:tetraacyldisaccharide 4'-kinase [Aquabacterium sp.]HSW04521.1 tetraacyldisaccharide 4'-kinase [Aquabacterium sp.]